MPADDDLAPYADVDQEPEGRRPVGARPGTRVVQGSRENPERWPDAGGKNRKADIAIYRGVGRKRWMRGIPINKVTSILARQAANQVRAVAYDAMSNDKLGESFMVVKLGRPNRWTYTSSV